MKTLVSMLATIVATSIGQAHASIIQFDISGLDSIGPDVLFELLAKPGMRVRFFGASGRRMGSRRPFLA